MTHRICLNKYTVSDNSFHIGVGQSMVSKCFFRNNYAFEETDTPTEHGLPNPTLVFPSFSLITI